MLIGTNNKKIQCQKCNSVFEAKYVGTVTLFSGGSKPIYDEECTSCKLNSTQESSLLNKEKTILKD